MKEIKVGKSHVALVDDEDFDFLNQFKWYLHNLGYVQTSKKGLHSKFIHRIIMQTPKGLDTDHINGNKLDNRKSNLRVCTHEENMQFARELGLLSGGGIGTRADNFKKSNKRTSKYIGVYWFKNRNKWHTAIRKAPLRVFIGEFTNEIDAALAYNKKSIELFGEKAYINKI